MEKVEQFIKEHIKETSSPIIDWDGNIAIYQLWLTPKDVKKVAKIAREETIKEVCEWIDDTIYDYIEVKHKTINTFVKIDGERLIEDLKKHLEDKV